MDGPGSRMGERKSSVRLLDIKKQNIGEDCENISQKRLIFKIVNTWPLAVYSKGIFHLKEFSMYQVSL